MKISKLLLALGLILAPRLILADETISQGLTVQIPNIRSTNWGVSFRENFAKPISSHDHTGGGKGLQIGAGGLQSNSITGAKMRLNNNETLRARNAANSADVDLFKLDASDFFTISRDLYLSADEVITQSTDTVIHSNTSNGSDSKSLSLTAGGAIAAGRGGRLQLYGTEHASQAGKTFLYAGGSTLTLATEGAQDMYFMPNEVLSFYIRGAGEVGLRPQKWFHFRNNADSADVNFARLNSSDAIELGALTLTGTTNMSGLTASLPLFLDSSKNIISPSVATARTTLGLGTGDKPSFAGVTLTAGSTYTATAMGITADTSDGSDSKAIAILGGGLPAGTSQARGGYLYAAGNEHATTPGVAQIFGGDISNGRVDIFAPATNGVVNLGAGSTSNDWQLEADGDLAQDATNGGDVIFSRAGKGVANTVDASLAGNGGGLTKSVSVITSGSSGRVLPAASGWVGKEITVINTSASSNDVSCAGADTIVNAPPFFTLTTNAAAKLVGIDSTHWALIENP